METFGGEWLVLAFNAILIAIVITIPLLVGLIILRFLRRGVSEDRRAFEDQVLAKLGEMADSLADIARRSEGGSN